MTVVAQTLKVSNPRIVGNIVAIDWEDRLGNIGTYSGTLDDYGTTTTVNGQNGPLFGVTLTLKKEI